MNRFSEASSNHRVVRDPPPPPRPWGGVRGGVTGKEVRSIFYVQHAVCCRILGLPHVLTPTARRISVQTVGSEAPELTIECQRAVVLSGFLDAKWIWSIHRRPF